MSSGPFNCIFCTETFESREVLQVHFRKHGDPNQHAKLKTGNKRAGGGVGAAGGGGAAAAEATASAEDVSCDVCSEQFPTVARAITHKHKFHRDHRVKNFCPWCGKLFPIKHLLDKHIATHESQVKPSECEQLSCDECQFEFYSCSAVAYHNRSFHREDASGVLPLAGSKKYRLLNKELVQVFFCHLCGEEYINSFNLQKHISEQHTSPEWPDLPEELLRCPRCDASFHSLAAYTAHLAHHSPQDIYTHPQENLNDLTEFTIETLPPIIEKMEPPEQIDIDQMLAVDLELSSSHGSQEPASPTSESESSRDKKSRNGPAPRKAITLNQFLSMNKDVFGDVFSCQGVEEVPSQVVANQLRPKRPPQKRPQPVVRPGTKIMSADNLQRLKQQGVVVQVKPPNRRPLQVGNKVTVANGVAIGKTIKIATGAVQQSKAMSGQVLQQARVPTGTSQQSKVATGAMQPVKMALGALQQPKVASGAVQQQPKVATSIGQQSSVANVGQQPKLATGVTIQSKVQTSVGQQPKVATSVGQQSKVVSTVQQPQGSMFTQAPRPTLKKVMKPPAPRSPAPSAGKPLKMSPSLARPPAPRPVQTKKPNEVDASMPGPFSCFKKPKESLIPISDVPGISELLRPELTVSSPAQPTKLNVTTAINSVKTSPTASDDQDPEKSSQELNKNKHKTLPLEALEKLKKQGLLVKKPRLDGSNSRDNSQGSDAPCLTVKSGG